MADITDTNNTLGRLENERERLRTAEIDDRDRDAIQDFIEHREEIEDVSPNTLLSDMGTLRRSSERAATALVDMDIGDVRAFLGRLTDPEDAGGFGLDPDGGGIFGYKRSLRVFFNWLDEEPDYGDFDFGDRIELPRQDYDAESISREDLLSEAEIEELKGAANNPRDSALVDFLADVGARISLATSLRVGDISGLDTSTPTFRPNDEAINQKGVEQKDYPILYSRAELREWINRHHPDPHPDAPLWPVLKSYDPDNRSEMAASGDAVRGQLTRMCESAGIDREITPHHFRHVFMTRIANSDLSNREIQHMSMLTDQELRMLEVYDHSSDEEHNERIFETFGFDVEASDDGPEIGLIECPNCRETVKSTAHYCPRCSTPVQEEARAAVEEVEEDTTDRMVAEDSERKRAAMREMLRMSGVDEAVTEEVVDQAFDGE